jgi:hypothetical protein
MDGLGRVDGMAWMVVVGVFVFVSVYEFFVLRSLFPVSNSLTSPWQLVFLFIPLFPFVSKLRVPKSEGFGKAYGGTETYG